MQKIDFSNIELSLYQKFVMHTLPILRSGFFYKKDVINDLARYGLIKRQPRILFGYFVYKRTDEGKMYFRIKRKNTLRFWIPVIISIIALLKSYDVLTIPVIDEVLQELSILLKNIAESLGVFR